MITKPGFAVAFICLAVFGTSPVAMCADTMVYRKSISNGRELVVVRTDAIAMDTNGLLPADEAANTAKVYCVRLEIHRPDQQALVLWTRLAREPVNPIFGGFDVLDSLLNDGKVYLATAEFGSIYLWRLDLLSGSVSVANLPGAGWAVAAAVQPLDHTLVHVAFHLDEKNRHLTVDVTDLRPKRPGKPKTFAQNGEWNFAPVTRVGAGAYDSR